ncbi:MAG TPA: DegT/DnrJ/EryC1/StrS family aminotransferase [Candidatus Paceibacterota bacterium]|nr:DegT/DnrJ/EryC1/StrS family aminotransferase [Verrucomicrobiota bacterium]HRZ45412.1 DegT/DnrJ/EryC1/StrS family aminotransferase [Candidatus Paceibacterota bacterium]HRZ92559.1 DegT/DnrJ/EryC1/StrS family aminotransferase [Candidatus Paceibacterota bacterium]
MTIPFLDLKAHHAPLREEFLGAIGEVIDSGAFASGPFVAQFERDFAAFSGAPYAVGVGNGTDALWLSLLALGVGPGDEVITSPSTFLATAEAISFCGATPVFVDVDERTCTLDPARIEPAITRQTRAIIPVHLYGQMADMDPILEIARRHGLMVIEDACQAHGAAYKGRRAGSLGITGCFSFYPGKNLGAFGEAGAVTTASDDLRKKIMALRDHGQARKYHHDMIGWNGRMDGIQGAVLGIKLKRLERNNELRRAHAAAYGQALEGIEGLIAPVEAAYGQHVYHIYAVRLPDPQARDQVLEEMAARGVQCGIHYPIPVHLQEAYRFLGYGPGSFPVAERWASQCLSLPMFPELTADQIAAVVRELKACVQAVVHRAPTVAVA